jgi:hypothetical protein
MQNLFQITNAQMTSELGSHAKLGKLFAFFERSLFVGDGPLSWVGSFAGGSDGPRLVSLLGVQGTRLPGLSHAAVDLRLDLGVLLTDKELYREGKDTVNLSVLDPLRASMDREIILELQGAEFRRIPVRLNCHGMANVPLSQLPVGQYTARFTEEGQVHPIRFTVAEYRLAPLVASLQSKSLQGTELSFTLRLESFGHPVNGEVLIELTSMGQRSQNATLVCTGGLLSGVFNLQGEGPFSLNVQMVSDFSRTATVPLSGTRASEREATIFGRLGKVVQGALLPTPSSGPPTRGIYLEEAGFSNSPFVLERVDDKRARLTARASAQALTVVIADPAVWQADKLSTAEKHPVHTCSLYQEGRDLFKAGEYSAARSKLEQGHAAQADTPHCSYSYCIACCYARLGRSHEAMAWLRRAVLEGWTDWTHMSKDPDFESLRDLPGFQLLCRGGRREEVFEQVEAGQTLEFEVPSPLAFIAVGAYVNGKPYEDWSFLIPPCELEAELSVPETAEPGQALKIEVTCSVASGVLLVVKDKRLQTGDTATSKLAGQLKDCVEKVKDRFPSHQAPEAFGSLRPPVPDARDLFDEPLFGSEPGARPSLGLRAGLIPRPGISTGAGGASPRSGPVPLGSSRPTVGRPRAMLRSGPMEELRSESIFEADDGLFEVAEEAGLFDEGDTDYFGGGGDLFGGGESADFALEMPQAAASAAPVAVKETPSRRPPATQDEPEVLYAGVLETRDGRVAVVVNLPDNFGDYLVEATILSGRDWTTFSKSCQVKADPYVSLEVPPFVHSQDQVRGRVLTSPGARVELFLDDEPQALDEEHGFRVKPGLYRVTVTSAEGQSRSQERRVNAPGRLRRLVQSVQLLKEGDTVSLKSDPSILNLKVLPGLKKPFKLLVNTTADYGHLCCEQTAAKMMSATLMALSGDPKGEAIFISGTHRMETMLLHGGGFSMYPENGGLDTYWGPKAVIYLLGLSGLVGRPEFSAAMSESLERCLKMAQESQGVYHISWPAPELKSCQEAYWSVREARDSKALQYVKEYVQGSLNPEGVGRVQFRAEACYAAATLLLCKTETTTALDLSNRVFAELDGGRLYSTYDSVAAIVLMNELRRAGIGVGDGVVCLDGQNMPTAEAVKRQDFQELICREKLCLVQISKMVEEDWEQFDASVPMRLSLEKDGRGGTSFTAGDSIDLKVELEDGYKVGDLVWVCLPDCLSRVMGGGQVKRFSVDFEGLNSITVPLAATGVTGDSRQHFAVCVRNMFEEERVGNPGLLTVEVKR